jgi:hypothetical protein
MLQQNKPRTSTGQLFRPLRCSDPVSIDCQSFAISLVDLLCRWRGGWFNQFADNPDPHFLTFGPKNRREFLANLKARGGLPV